MKIPLIWLKDYINTKGSVREVAGDFTALGLMLDKIVDGDVLDLEHRMDRSDWLSITGCARDLAALQNIKLDFPTSEIPASNGNGEIKIKIDAPELVKRFNTHVFKNIKVGDSPKWLKERLEAYGMPSINNVVDITNFVMVEIGQPMHAQDLSKMKNPMIQFRRGKKGETCTTLLGEVIEVDEDTLVMTDGEQITGIGGIVGSPTTAVDENTTEIILDAGNYNYANIRKTSRRLNIRNETVLRTEKFLHPHSTQVAIERATALILELTGGEYYENEDYYPNPENPIEMQLRFSRIEKIGGITIGKEKIKEILLALGYKILSESQEGLNLEIPYFRTDIQVEDDIVSDILRINNYKNIPNELITAAPPKEATPANYKLEEKLKDEMVKLGAHEHITNPLVMANGEKGQLILENSLNSEQNALRTSIYETLAPVLKIYKKHKIPVTVIFETGLVYNKNLSETKMLTVVVNTGGGVKSANFELKRILSALLKNLGVGGVVLEKGDNEAKIMQGTLELGELKIDHFNLLVEGLLKAEKKNLRTKSEIMHSTYEDITLDASKESFSAGGIAQKIKKSSDLVKDVVVADIYDGGGKKSVTFRVYIESENELNQEEIRKILDLTRNL